MVNSSVYAFQFYHMVFGMQFLQGGKEELLFLQERTHTPHTAQLPGVELLWAQHSASDSGACLAIGGKLGWISYVLGRPLKVHNK